MSHAHSRRRPTRLQIETLERRCLLTATIEGRVLVITGDAQDNLVDIELSADTLNILVTGDDGVQQSFLRANVDSIRVRSLAGDDEINIDSTITLNCDIDVGNGDDVVQSGGGNDTIIGGAGSDDLSGGAGNDRIAGEVISPVGATIPTTTPNAGDDIIDGESGNDDLGGQEGNDDIFGGPGDDTIRGRQGNDDISGDDGNDSIRGGFGSDTIDGGAGDDLLVGREGADSISGGAGNDTLGDDNQVEATQQRIAGSPPITFGAANDTLNGGDGIDVLLADQGVDSLIGGAGADVFGRGTASLMNDLSSEDVDTRATVPQRSHTDSDLRGELQTVASDTSHFTYGSEETHPFVYSTDPPTSGPHFSSAYPVGIYNTLPGPSAGEQAFTADERIVHNLEHGHVVVWYNPTQVFGRSLVHLQLLVSAFPSKVVLAARTNNPSPVTLTSWGRLQRTNAAGAPLSASDSGEIRDFIARNRNHGPEDA